MNDRWIRILRWTARISALIMVGFVLIFFIADGVGDSFYGLTHLDTRASLMMIAFIIVWLGLLVGLRWEILGGTMVVAGMIAFYLLDFIFSGSFPRGLFLFLIAVPGLLYLSCGLIDRKTVS